MNYYYTNNCINISKFPYFQNYYSLQQVAFEKENELKAELFEESVDNKNGILRYSFDFDNNTISCVM